ncbi:MAG: ATP-binding cassette domain-containing protein [Bacteroidetes bacterium]|nr:MAG: ATP-binding cassette domain-containing protein [Bacteroidota bacterium]
MAVPAVDIRDLTHRYGAHEALHAVTLTVAPGHLYGLLGPNGGGKTTLFRILSTLLRPTSGVARVFGLDTVAEPDRVRRRLGVVFQQPALDDELTVTENLWFHGALYGLSGTRLRERIETLLTLFGLADRRRDRIKTLSGGLQRRVDLVRSLLHQPDLLLLDEPTTGLDPVARRAFWQLLHRIRRQEGTTMLLATHLLDEADPCDAVGIIDRGRLVTQGAPEALKAALGGETLWIETNDPADLRDRLLAQFGLEARIIGSALQLASPDAPALLSRIYEAFGDRIDRAMIRKPTLEDVFMTHTGHRLDPAPADAMLEG